MYIYNYIYIIIYIYIFYIQKKQRKQSLGTIQLQGDTKNPRDHQKGPPMKQPMVSHENPMIFSSTKWWSHHGVIMNHGLFLKPPYLFFETLYYFQKVTNLVAEIHPKPWFNHYSYIKSHQSHQFPRFFWEV